MLRDLPVSVRVRDNLGHVNRTLCRRRRRWWRRRGRTVRARRGVRSWPHGLVRVVPGVGLGVVLVARCGFDGLCVEVGLCQRVPLTAGVDRASLEGRQLGVVLLESASSS